MSNTRELRRRIKSVKNTSQITKAMQMVAATKMKKAQDQALSGRPYSLTLELALDKLLPKMNGTHPLMETKEGKTGVLVLSTDKSLCGALNNNLFRALAPHISGGSTKFYTLGKKGRQFVVRMGKELVADFENPEHVAFRQAKQTAKVLTDAFLIGEIAEAYIAYPEFVSALRQEPKVEKILPLDVSAEVDSFGNGLLFDTDPASLLDYILTHYIETKIYQALLETKASEHSARMIAMQNATDNAKDLVEDLQLTYNQTRQGAITQELLEITTAQAALE